MVLDQNNNNCSSVNVSQTSIQYSPTDPTNGQYRYQTQSPSLNDTQNQLSKLRILCNAKDRKITQLENLCEEYRNKYESNIRMITHELELSESKSKDTFVQEKTTISFAIHLMVGSKYDLDKRYQMIATQCDELLENNNQLQRTVSDAELHTKQLETIKMQVHKYLLNF